MHFSDSAGLIYIHIHTHTHTYIHRSMHFSDAGSTAAAARRPGFNFLLKKYEQKMPEHLAR